MDKDNIYFDSVKEKGEDCIIEYAPPLSDMPFATLTIIYVKEVPEKKVIADLKKQSEIWVKRYPVSLMASAFNKQDALIHLPSKKDSAHLTTLVKGKSVETHWELLTNDKFPEQAFENDSLIATYPDLGHRTQREINADIEKEAKYMRVAKLLILTWAVFIPATISIILFFSPMWVGAIALVYSLWKAYQKWKEMTGRKKKTEKELSKERDEFQKEHHHYHCKQNPEGFEKLKLENFKKSTEEDLMDEFESLSET